MVGWLDARMVGWSDGRMVGWLDGTEIFEYTPDRNGPKTRATLGQASLRSELQSLIASRFLVNVN